MNPINILIVEDQDKMLEALVDEFKNYPKPVEIFKASNCDDAYAILKKHKITNPIEVVITDITFKIKQPYWVLKDGFDFLRKLKEDNLDIKKIVYTEHQELKVIHPIITNYHPDGYILKSHHSKEELHFGLNQVLQGKTYYSQLVHEELNKRFKFEFKIDDIDIAILRTYPEIKYRTDWEDKIKKEDGTYMSSRRILDRLHKLCDVFEVDTEAQLILKAYKIGLIP